MKESVERLALLLAASGLSEKAIFEALKASKNVDESELVARIRFLRQFLFSRLGSVEETSKGPSANADRDQRLRTAERVIRLLQTEGHLNGLHAAQLLLDSLSEDGVDVRDFPKFRSKEGLRTWLTQLPIQTSELLHHATKIRNRLVHSRSGAWPLRDRSS
jgi:hypothetical protein